MKVSTDNLMAWSKNYSNWLPVIQWTSWVVIIVILAKLFWVVTLHITSPDVSKQTISVKPKTSQSKSRDGTNIQDLISRHLFGDTELAPVKVIDDVVEIETRLNLKLKGTYASENNHKSNSIIEDGKGKQAVYFIDDKLQVSGRVYLRQVFVDKVVIETNGTREFLRLEDSLPPIVKSKSNRLTVKKASGKRVEDKRKNQQISQSLRKYKKQLQENPLGLIDIIGYKPKMNANGEMIGISISPGKDKRLFTQLGLRRNDVVTSINGVSLSDPQNAMQLMADIQNMQELEVEINRGNETISLLLNLNDKVGI